MATPGTRGGYFTATGLEHNEEGTPTYTAEMHTAQTAKRFRKMETALKEISNVEIIGSKKADIGIISWGSTTGATIEAANLARETGIKVKVFKTTVIWPFPKKEVIEFAKSVRKIIIPEMNYQGQLANLLDFIKARKVIRFNVVTGVPISPYDILDQIKKVHNVLSKK